MLKMTMPALCRRRRALCPAPHRLPLHPQMRLRGAARTHLDECGDAFQHHGQPARVRGAAFVDQFRQQLEVVVRVVQPLGGVVQQRFRAGTRIGKIASVAGGPGFAEDVHG